MAVQRILLLVAAVAAVALVFGLPRVFEETNEAAVPPVELGDDLAKRRAEPPRRERERERPRRTATPEATTAPPPAPAVPPSSDDDDGGGDG